MSSCTIPTQCLYEKLGGRIGRTSRRGKLWEQYKGKNLDFCLGTIDVGTVVTLHTNIPLPTLFFKSPTGPRLLLDSSNCTPSSHTIARYAAALTMGT
jgi:hypothetical protein